MVEVPSQYIYLIYTLILALILIVVVPKSEIRRLAVYGVLFGALGNVAVITILGRLLNVGGHQNFEPFGFMEYPFFPPIAWSIYFILFLYILPEKKPYNYLFTFTATVYVILFTNVLINLDIFTLNYGRIIVPLLIYGGWHFTVMIFYQKYFHELSLY